jgi:hypothetical protein
MDMEMSEGLTKLLEQAKDMPMTLEEREEQRRSFAHGTIAMHNPGMTREMIDQAAEELENPYDAKTNPEYNPD